MKIYCPTWGKWHLELLDKALLTSLRWPRNLAAIQGAEWIFTVENEDEARECYGLIEKLPGHFSARVYMMKGLPGSDVGMALMTTLVPTIKECARTGEPMLMATPDFIYSEGAIDAFKKEAKDPGACVTIAHMRVLPDVLPLPAEPLTNSQLMQLGFNNAHKSWVDAKDGGNTYSGGFRWQDHGSMKSVRHYLPSPFFVKFLDSDVQFFQEPHNNYPAAFGLWDHIWPTELLKHNRLRFIGSSDLACMIEVTKPENNVPPSELKGEGYWRKEFHNLIQNQFVSVFRGE